MIVADLEGTILSLEVAGIYRDDVVKLYGAEAIGWGFEATLCASDVAEVDRIRIRILSGGSQVDLEIDRATALRFQPPASSSDANFESEGPNERNEIRSDGAL